MRRIQCTKNAFRTHTHTPLFHTHTHTYTHTNIHTHTKQTRKTHTNGQMVRAAPTRSTTALWLSCVPWLMLRRATFMPARRRRGFGSVEVGRTLGRASAACHAGALPPTRAAPPPCVSLHDLTLIYELMSSPASASLKKASWVAVVGPMVHTWGRGSAGAREGKGQGPASDPAATGWRRGAAKDGARAPLALQGPPVPVARPRSARASSCGRGAAWPTAAPPPAPGQPRPFLKSHSPPLTIRPPASSPAWSSAACC